MTFRFATLAMIIAVVILFSSCDSEKDDHQLVILCALSMDENCVVSDNPENCISKGLLDLNHPVSRGEPVYYLFPLIEGYSEYNGEPSGYDDVLLMKATIAYEWIAGRELLKKRDDLSTLLRIEDGQFDIYTSGVVSGDGSHFTRRMTNLRVIPPHVGAGLTVLGADADNITLGVRISVRAEAPDGTWLSSNELLFPIDLCWGCLSEVCPDGIYPSCTPGQDGNILSCE